MFTPLHMQFIAQCNLFGENNNLDIIERRERKTEDDANVIDSPEDLEQFMFEALRLTNHDKTVIAR